MRTLLLVAGAAALGLAAPAVAKGPGGHGMSMGGPGGHGMGMPGSHAMTMRGPGTHMDMAGHGGRHFVTNRTVRRNAFGRHHGAACPPGLAKKPVACVPPGQVGRNFVIGQRAPTGFGTLAFTRIPLSVRTTNNLDRNNLFIRRGTSLVILDRRTRIVQQIIPNAF